MASAREKPDICGALEDALRQTLNFTGAISFHQSYQNAPNPGITLPDVGPVGLPLNPREAEVIKAHAEQAPFGMGERTVVDTSIRDTWQMDARTVKFRNPTWNTWLNNVVQEVCRTLGVFYECVTILRYSFLAANATKFSSPRRFGEIGRTSAVYDTSLTSDLQTSVMAWYTDVTHEVKPITSGYRLALSYNLIHTTTSLRPALPGDDSIMSPLRNALLAWKADAGAESPDKILYLLKHKYSQASLNGSALKGSDAQHAALLDPLCKELGFCLGLASVECHKEGACADGGSHNRRRKRFWQYDASDSDVEEEIDYDDDDDASFVDVFEQSMTISDFVDLQGEPLTGEIELDSVTETIPDDLEETVVSGAYDEQEYEGYTGNEGSTLERWYRRTVLVIWPKYAYCAIMDDVCGACDGLDIEADQLETSTPELSARINFLLNRFGRSSWNGILIAKTVCKAAVKWNEPELWKRAVDSCSIREGVRIVGVEELHNAIRKFGFQAIQPSLDLMVQRETKNENLFSFFNTFRLWNLAEDDKDPDQDGQSDHRVDSDSEHLISNAAAAWIEVQYSTALKALRKLQPGEFPLLVELAAKQGGPQYLRDNVLPQIALSTNANVLKEFAIYLSKEQVLTVEWESQLKREIIARTLRSAISNLKIRLMPISAYSSGIRPNAFQSDPSLDTAKSYFETCLSLHCPDLLDVLTDKVADTTEYDQTEAGRYARVVMVTFLSYVVEKLSKQTDDHIAIPSLPKLQMAVVTYLIDGIAQNPKIARPEEITRLFLMSTLFGSTEIIVTSIIPRIEALAITEDCLRTFLAELHSRSDTIAFPPEYTGPRLPEILDRLGRRYASLAKIETCDAVTNAVDFCIRMQATDKIRTILNRVLDPDTLKKSPDPYWSTVKGPYCDRVVLPLVAKLRELALRYDMLDAFLPAFQMIARTWVQKVLGPVPAGDLTNRFNMIRCWPCRCQYCKPVQTFLLSTPEESIYLERIGAKNRKHVEVYLNQHVTREGATWETITSSPQGLKVTKSKLLHDHTLWRANHRKTIQIFNDISPGEEERKRIFGAEYPAYASLLNVVAEPPPTAAQQRTSAAGPSSGNKAQGQSTAGVRRKLKPSAAAPPAKRLKASGSNFIDLTK
ncbi:hypothetical protein NM688_g5980 [Phlebia brevispora]|uniref:Uncharacterized protein n=1 Tax=Phlebia brevispora TaxID=194682 RepID=A0ACC1SLU7_9APHY|nr:hypothetical protein NM688_g5980 [Phlebia brevispora]